MAKRYRLPPMNRCSSLIRIARTSWSGGRGSAKAIWVPVVATIDGAVIKRATRRLAILPNRSFPKMHVHLRPAKGKAAVT